MMLGMRVTVETYDSRWPRDFERIRLDLEAALREVDLLRIEHVGSTSVPGLRQSQYWTSTSLSRPKLFPRSSPHSPRSGITMRDNSGYLVGTPYGHRPTDWSATCMCVSRGALP